MLLKKNDLLLSIERFKRYIERRFSMLEECLTQLVENLALENALSKENKLYILTCPLNKREEVFMYLMKANLLGQGTGGSIIGLDRDEKFLTLCLVLPYDMKYKVFKDALEDFTNYLDFWKNELSCYQ